MRGRRSILLVLLVAYGLALGLALLAPTSQTQSAMVDWLGRVLGGVGAPASLTGFRSLEVVMNAVIVAPVSFLGAALWPRYRWRDWTAAGFVVSLAVETIQLVALPGRQASFSDVVANTLGAALGALLFGLLMSLVSRSRAVPVRSRRSRIRRG